MLNKLPARFQWTLHNVVGHPMMEIFTQLGLLRMANKVHDWTMP